MSDAAVVRLHGAQIYQGDTLVLADVSLTIPDGEFVYLIGRTGAGKSSLLKTLYAQLQLRDGTGEVCGFDLKQLDRRSIPQLRRSLGIVFQEFNLLDDRDAIANLSFVLEATGWRNRGERAARITEVLTQVGLADKAAQMPRKLSGGERQRLVLARALLNKPRLLIADEPTGNLDPETSDDVMQLIRSLAADYGMAVLFATHDYRIIEHFPGRILRCRRGKVWDERDMEVI